MNTNPSYRFPAAQRLKGRKKIHALISEGKRFRAADLRVVYKTESAASGHVEAGVSVSKRFFKRAADRNRIKRLLREAYRLQKAPLIESCTKKKTGLRFFVFYIGRSMPEFDTVFAGINFVTLRLQQTVEKGE